MLVVIVYATPTMLFKNKKLPSVRLEIFYKYHMDLYDKFLSKHRNNNQSLYAKIIGFKLNRCR